MYIRYNNSNSSNYYYYLTHRLARAQLLSVCIIYSYIYIYVILNVKYKMRNLVSTVTTSLHGITMREII